MKQIFVNEDLRGKILDASKFPDGHARESLILDCLTDTKTRFIGDWRGSDFLGFTGPADWSQAQTFGCDWNGDLEAMTGSSFPSDIGYIQTRALAVLIASRIDEVVAQLKMTERTKATEALLEVARATREVDQTEAGGYAAIHVAWRQVYGLPLLATAHSDPLGVQVARAIVKGYPNFLARMEAMWDNLDEGNIAACYAPVRPTSRLTWPSCNFWEKKVVLDVGDLPDLPSRYDLRKWLQEQADAQVTPDESNRPHYCFVYSKRPFKAQILTEEDGWTVKGWPGY